MITKKEHSTRSALIKELLQKHAIHSQEETPPKYGFRQLALEVSTHKLATHRTTQKGQICWNAVMTTATIN